MKTFTSRFTQDASGRKGTPVKFVRFYSGTTWTMDAYLRRRKMQQMRRAVIDKKPGLQCA